ncbi:MAG: hypothetical protein OEZ58_08235 [Gammaproteobacteria bacterium]|nr:hypothetical protein [Gammaproteobacteria bacterium]MDH5728963.1 hypothetical protein [Gammaproteobacteria bacterium]
MNINNPKQISRLSIFFLLLSTSSVIFADEWTCTEIASKKEGNNFLVCGVATAETEGEAREQALLRAKREFELICESSSDCKDHEINIEPLRNSCETLESGKTKCLRALRYTVLDETNTAAMPAVAPVAVTALPPPVTPVPPVMPTPPAPVEKEKNSGVRAFTAGLSSYTLHLKAEQDQDVIRHRYAGRNLFFNIAFFRRLGLNLNFYSLNKRDGAGKSIKGQDVMLQFGRNLNRNGLKSYWGLGLFKETLNIAGKQEEPEGWQFTFGLGANIQAFSVEYNFYFRRASKYTDIFYQTKPDLFSDLAYVHSFRFGGRF